MNPSTLSLAAGARIALTCLDLTSLNDLDTEADIAKLCQRAQSPLGHVAAVCVWPRLAAFARSQLPAHIAVAAVANFPHGNADVNAAVRDTQQIVQTGAHEVDVLTAKAIIDKQFDAFTKKHYERIMERLEIDEDALRDAIEVIVRLNPKPGNTGRDTTKSAQAIVPDFAVNAVDGQLELSLNGRNAPELRVSRQYRDMIKEYQRNKKDPKAKDALVFIKQKLDSAKWFIDAIKQRQNTLLITMEAIMEHQRDFFLTGDETKMKPMILKDIAEKVSMDISTVSRVANSKYVQTDHGTYLLKFFFSESLMTDSGEEVSTREVKKILEEAIIAENKQNPLTDDELTKLLRGKGYNIARRTVAKYREQLHMPVARLRKEL